MQSFDKVHLRNRTLVQLVTQFWNAQFSVAIRLKKLFCGGFFLLHFLAILLLLKLVYLNVYS